MVIINVLTYISNCYRTRLDKAPLQPEMILWNRFHTLSNGILSMINQSDMWKQWSSPLRPQITATVLCDDKLSYVAIHRADVPVLVRKYSYWLLYYCYMHLYPGFFLNHSYTAVCQKYTLIWNSYLISLLFTTYMNNLQLTNVFLLFGCDYTEHKGIKHNEIGSVETAHALHMDENFCQIKAKPLSDSVILCVLVISCVFFPLQKQVSALPWNWLFSF